MANEEEKKLVLKVLLTKRYHIITKFSCQSCCFFSFYFLLICY